MTVEKGKGIVIDEKDGCICDSGGRPYWDAGFQQLVRKHLGEFCPGVSFGSAGRNKDGEDAFRATFSMLDEQGRELCGDSVSLDDGAKIPRPAIVAFQERLDAFHRLAQDPQLRNLQASRQFIEDFRVPDPMRMKKAWRMTKGKNPRLLVLWGWYDRQGGLATTFLPKSDVSGANFGDASRDAIMGRAEPFIVSDRKIGLGKWLKRFAMLAAILLSVAGLWWLFSQLGGCDGIKKHADKMWGSSTNKLEEVKPPAGNLPPIDPRFRIEVSDKYKIGDKGRFYPRWRIVPTDGERDAIANRLEIKHVDWMDTGSLVTESISGVYIPLNGYGSNEVRMVSAVVEWIDRATKKTCTNGAGRVEWRLPMTLPVKPSEKKEGTVKRQIVPQSPLPLPSIPQPVWRIQPYDVGEAQPSLYDDAGNPILKGSNKEWRFAVHRMEFRLLDNQAEGVECCDFSQIRWVDQGDFGVVRTVTGATYRAEYRHEAHKRAGVHRVQAFNVMWTNKMSKVGGVGSSLVYVWDRNKKSITGWEPPKIDHQHNNGQDLPRTPEGHLVQPENIPPMNRNPTEKDNREKEAAPINGNGGERVHPNEPIGIVCGTCGAQIPSNGQCPNLCKTCGVHLGRDGDGLWRECPNVCKKHNRHKIDGVCSACSGDEIVEVRCWIDVRSNPVSLREKVKFDNMMFSLRSSEADLSGARVSWEDEIGGNSVFVTNAVGTIQAADIIRDCLRKGFAWDKINSRHTLRASTVVAPGGKPVRYAASVSWKPKLSDAERKAIERHIRLCGEERDGENEFFLFMLYSNPADPDAVVKRWEVSLDKGMDGTTPLKSMVDPKLANAIRLYKKDIPRDGGVSIGAELNVGRTVRGSFAYVAGAMKIGNAISYKEDYARAVSIAADYRTSIPLVIAAKSKGTAFAVSDRDLITNYHVISGSVQSVSLKVADFRGGTKQIGVRVEGYDVQADLAWLRVTGDYRFARPLPIANGVGVPVGMPILPLGYPYDSAGKYELPKTGVIKSTDRSGRILHSAEILPGNSGGPLVSIKSGKVVGVTVAVKTREIGTEAFYGYGCAIPVGQIFKSFPQLTIK